MIDNPLAIVAAWASWKLPDDDAGFTTLGIPIEFGRV